MKKSLWQRFLDFILVREEPFKIEKLVKADPTQNIGDCRVKKCERVSTDTHEIVTFWFCLEKLMESRAYTANGRKSIELEWTEIARFDSSEKALKAFALESALERSEILKHSRKKRIQ